MRGLRSYLAVNGCLEVPATFGSVAPDRSLDVDNRLRPGDVLTCRTEFAGFHQPHLGLPLFRLGAVPPRFARELVVDTTPGPEADQYQPDALSGSYQVSPQSDHVGLRVTGPTPNRSTNAEILSRGVPVGAIEVPPSGGLLVLLRGRLVTAGYPVPSVAVDRLGQVRPGDCLRFRLRSTADALADARRQHESLVNLAGRVHAAFASSGLPHIIAPRHLSRG